MKYMNKLINSATLALIIFFLGNIVIVAQDYAPEVQKNYKFINGNWFNGESFEKKTFYSVYGTFSSVAPKKIDETIDLENAYVLPPFGDTHNHSIEFSYNLESFSNKMFKQGIFYLKNPNSVPRFTKNIADKINKPNTIDVVFSGGGLTATGGHPISLYDEGLAKGPYSFAKITSYDGLGYHIIDNVKDLQNKWETILAGNPDFIKTYLLFSENYEKTVGEKKDYGSNSIKAKGLNPALLPLIVKKAHEAGLRVSVHINSSDDFGVAVRAGVDEINHLPGRFLIKGLADFDKYKIKEADSKLAAEKGIYVVPTYSLFTRNEEESEEIKKKIRDIQRENLKLLNKYGVKITFGPDTYNSTSQLEAFYIKDLGIFSNLELIKMWAEYTPQTIFPNRKIAKLKMGYEASFIAMPENPLDNFDAVKNIKYRFKQGVPLEKNQYSER